MQGSHSMRPTMSAFHSSPAAWAQCSLLLLWLLTARKVASLSAYYQCAYESMQVMGCPSCPVTNLTGCGTRLRPQRADATTTAVIKPLS